MKKKSTLLSILLPLFVFKAQSQSWQSTCTGTPYLQERYKADVFKLSLERLIETGNPWKDSIDFPQIYKDTIAQAFYAFSNMEYTPYKDTILSGFLGISPGAPTYEAPSYLSYTIPSQDSSSVYNLFQSVRYFSVCVNNTANWADAWASGNYFNTPNAAVNKLLQENVISVSSCTEAFCISSTKQKFYTLKTNRPLNTNALVSAFRALPNVLDATPQPYFGGGNEMAIEFTANGLTLSFINNCADCDAGCNVTIAWVFKTNVFTTCQVNRDYVTPHFPIPENGGQGAPCNGCYSNGQYYIYPCINVVSSTLPVKLSTLNSTVKSNNSIQLGFTALTQADAYLYEIEHSTDGIVFTKITSLSPTLGSNSQSYTFTHNQAGQGNNYYRVKVIEKDGTTSYSNISLGFIGNRPNLFAIYPNPAKGSFRLSATDVSTLSRASLTISGSDGHKITEQPLQKTTVQNINIASLPTGIYWIAIHTSTGTQVQKLIVE